MGKKLFYFLLVVVCLTFYLKFNLTKTITVRGTSMEPLLHDGKTYKMEKLFLTTPKKGDVVAGVSPKSGVAIIKQVVATSGDIVKLTEDGLTLNGEPLDNSEYSKELFRLSEAGMVDLPWNGVEIPKDEFFLLGANREQSEDSRKYGFVPLDNIEYILQLPKSKKK